MSQLVVATLLLQSVGVRVDMLVEISHAREWKLGVNVAHRIVGASDRQWSGIVHELLAERQLSQAVQQMNRMLEDPIHEDLAKSALSRIGLLHDA